ncbi:aldo/keto reductase [Shigella flexneri]
MTILAIPQVENSRALLQRAFDLGIDPLIWRYALSTPGSAERNFRRILQEDFYRGEMRLPISTKAGYAMWEGPYGDWGSRKYLIASLNQSLKRLGLEYGIFSTAIAPALKTPLEKNPCALDHIVRQGKAPVVGLSNYPANLPGRRLKSDDFGTPCLPRHQISIFERWVEGGSAVVV